MTDAQARPGTLGLVSRPPAGMVSANAASTTSPGARCPPLIVAPGVVSAKGRCRRTDNIETDLARLNGSCCSGRQSSPLKCRAPPRHTSHFRRPQTPCFRTLESSNCTDAVGVPVTCAAPIHSRGEVLPCNSGQIGVRKLGHHDIFGTRPGVRLNSRERRDVGQRIVRQQRARFEPLNSRRQSLCTVSHRRRGTQPTHRSLETDAQIL